VFNHFGDFQMKIRTLFACLVVFAIFACDSATGPNDMGGKTDIDLTKVGNEFGVSIKIKGTFSSALQDIRDSVIITKNDNGIVTFKGIFFSTVDDLKAIDTLLGTHDLSDEIKHQVVDIYLAKYGATIDTSDQANLRLDVEFKLKITSEGIQDYFHAKGDLSKPFTAVKYSSNIGDKYEFTNSEGKKIVRTVIEKNPSEDWDLAFWRVKTIKVEELTPDDPLLQSIVYVGNHKFGLVGLIMKFKDGRVVETTVLPWNIM
jgi:hypothetical protein